MGLQPNNDKNFFFKDYVNFIFKSAKEFIEKKRFMEFNNFLISIPKPFNWYFLDGEFRKTILNKVFEELRKENVAELIMDDSAKFYILASVRSKAELELTKMSMFDFYKEQFIDEEEVEPKDYGVEYKPFPG